MRAVALLLLAACAPRRFEFAQAHMGTSARIVMYAEDAEDARRRADAAYAEIARLDAMMSDWRSDSELSRLNDSGDSVVSPELVEVLRRASGVSEATDGAFDVTVGPVTELWRQGVPDEADLAAARLLVDWRLVRIEGDRVTLGAGQRLDLGAIAKGYAAEVALRAIGGRPAMVELGGDLALGEPPPGEPGWRVAIPDGTLVASRCFVSRSGDTERFVEARGRRYSHVVNPETGVGVEGVTLVVVVACDGMTADATATAIGVAGLRVAGGVDAAVWRADGSVEETPGFRRYVE